MADLCLRYLSISRDVRKCGYVAFLNCSKSQGVFHRSGRKLPPMQRMVHAHHLGLHLKVALLLFSLGSILVFSRYPQNRTLCTFPPYISFVSFLYTHTQHHFQFPFTNTPWLVFFSLPLKTQGTASNGGTWRCAEGQNILSCFLTALAEGWWHSLIWRGVRLQSLSLLQIWHSHASRMSSCLSPGWKVTKYAYWKISTDFLKLMTQ